MARVRLLMTIAVGSLAQSGSSSADTEKVGCALRARRAPHFARAENPLASRPIAREITDRAAAQSDKALRLALGKKGFLEFGGLFQGWFIDSLDTHEPYVGLGAARSSFRIRRSEIKLSGEILPEVAFKVMFDVAKVLEFGSKSLTVSNATPADASKSVTVTAQQPASKLSPLQDMNLTFKFVPHLNFSIGQDKTQVSYDGATSSGRLLFIERSEVGRIFGDQRDMGVWAWYKQKSFGYHVGVYNGAGANTLDSSANKDLILRLELTPIPGLLIGASLQRTLADDAVGTAAFGGERTAVDGDVRYESGRFLAQAEVYYSKAIAKETLKETKPKGGFLAAAYTFDVGRYGLQSAVRFDYFDPDENSKDDDYWRLTVGVHLLLSSWKAHLKLNYTRTQAKSTSTGSTADVTNDLLLFAAQVAF